MFNVVVSLGEGIFLKDEGAFNNFYKDLKEPEIYSRIPSITKYVIDEPKQISPNDLSKEIVYSDFF